MENNIVCEIIEEKPKRQIKKCEHGRQKSYCKECGGSSICEHRRQKSTCKECCGSSICEHGRQKSYCKECGGSSICEHGRQKSYCKECGGGSICEHGKIKSSCKDCGGGSICEHGRIKSTCKECGGGSICEHGRRKSQCKDCGGGSICEHGKIKSRCKECGGGSICEHGREKTRCKECGGSSICEHGRDKRYCKPCGGGSICEHGRCKSYCKECGGGSICEHGREKRYCKPCGGSRLCKSSWCETYGNRKYNGYCLRCCINLFPETEVSRNYKTKEKDVVDRIIQWKPEYTWAQDKRIQDGCSKRRPDLLLDMGTHIIIVEIDENKHTGYSCENRRNMELSQDLQHRPIIFIRFNPDSYVTTECIKISSCWKTNNLGIFQVSKSKQKEWEHRIEILKCQIEYWTKTTIEKTIEIVELFYC